MAEPFLAVGRVIVRIQKIFNMTVVELNALSRRLVPKDLPKFIVTGIL